MSAYRSFVVSENNGAVSGEITIRNSRNLPQGDLLIKVKYSSLNYFDALALSGNKELVKQYPHTPGMDAAGIVVESSSPDFHTGDEVVVTGCGLGLEIPGGFGEYVRVPASWAVSVPTGLTLKDCMVIGSDGLAAALAVMDLMVAGGFSGNDNAVVSGALSGTGIFAVALLSKCGFHVTAVIKDTENADFLKTIGVAETVSCEKFADTSGSPMLLDRYSIGIDTLGGGVLSTIIRSLKKNGSAAVCSAVESGEISISLQPFIFRGINILGIDAVNCPLSLKKEAWYKLAGEWYIKALPMLCTEISLGELVEYGERLLKGDIKGRVVVNHEL